MTRNVVVEARNIKVFALLDSGCLVGDCMSQNIVDKLQATHLLVHVNTTICIGFDNKCDSSFPSLLINISFINEITSLRESFNTSVFILKYTPLDLIIGRATIKKQFFSLRTPSHFEDQTNLTVSRQIPGTFRERPSRESYSTTSLEQASQKAMAVRVQTHTVLSSPNPDDETVGSSMPSGKRKSDEIGNDTDLCLCSKALPWGSCKEGLDHPLPCAWRRWNRADRLE